MKAYRDANKEKIKRNMKKYLSSEKGKTYKKKCNQKFQNSKNGKIWLRSYERTQQRKKSHAEYRKRRRHKDINYHIEMNLRSRIYNAFKRNTKTISTFQLLGCSILELKGYLETLFESWMTWNNYGKGGWVIDHIIPCSSFDLTDEEQQRKCFHYTNLQPMGERENLIKKNKIIK